ncbi:MAG: hypothetical protein ABIA76_05790 [Candidatus Diapherotrites archaeon]
MKLYNSKEYLEEQFKTKNYLEIAKENNISKTTIQRKLNQFGLTKPKIRWSESEINLLKEKYSTIQDLTILLPYKTKSAIYHKSNRLRLIRPIRKRYNSINENFFKKWTKESAYVLGWGFSDGNVSKDGKHFGFHLNKKDIKVLKKIKKLLKSEHKLTIRGDYVQFRMYSKKMCRDLISLGCIPKKSLKLEFPKKIPKKYIRHFIRGCFEGDGTICFNYPNTIKIKLIGTKKFVNSLRKKIKEALKIKMPKIKRTSSIWGIEYYGNNARKFCKWIYKNNNNLYLERKYLRFVNHMKKGKKNGKL